MSNPKIKMFILTYNNPEHLHETLLSFNSSDRMGIPIELWIMNNHPNFKINPPFDAWNINVIHNNARPSWSWGHTMRSWNQCLMHGFVDLNNPQCDILITLQDDSIFRPDWLSILLRAHEKYTFIMEGHGDTMCSWTPEGVKNIGLWDERYCALAWGEADYQTAAVVYNAEKTCINTSHPLGYWNKLDTPYPYHTRTSFGHFVMRPRSQNETRRRDRDRAFGEPRGICADLYEYKWGFQPLQFGHDDDATNLPWIAENVKGTKCWNFMFYPYFELAVNDLQGKNYFYFPELRRQGDGIRQLHYSHEVLPWNKKEQK